MSEMDDLKQEISSLKEVMTDLIDVIKDLKSQKRQEVSDADKKSKEKQQNERDKATNARLGVANQAISGLRNEDPVSIISAFSTKLGLMVGVVEKVTESLTGLSERAGALEETHQTPMQKVIHAAASYAEQGVPLNVQDMASLYDTSRAMHQRRFAAIRQATELLARPENIIESVLDDAGLDISGSRARTSTNIQEFYERQGQTGINKRLDAARKHMEMQGKIHQNRRVNESR